MASDLTATAKSNEAARQAAAGARVAADLSGRLVHFRALVETSSFSTNVSADKVLEFDRAAEILDGRRFCVQKAGGDQIAGLADFASLQDKWLIPRQAFEDYWHHGRRTVYGAVNAGGMGTRGLFGPFCLSIGDPEVPVPDALAVFPADTAERYANSAGDLDEARMEAEATSWSDRAALAIIARGDEALARPNPDWPDVVCRPEHYLEVARAGYLPVAQVGEVRLRATDEANFYAAWERWLAGESQTPKEELQALAYDSVLDWCVSFGVGLVTVR